jgi:hypothetical protein
VIIRAVTGSLSSRPIDKTVVPTDYFKTSLTNLVFCYRGGDLVLLHLDFTGLWKRRITPIGANTTLQDRLRAALIRLPAILTIALFEVFGVELLQC